MESYYWIVWLLLAVAALTQLVGILRSLRSTEAMMMRLLKLNSIEWGVAAETSALVKELAAAQGNDIAAIKAYREQTGLDLKETRAVIGQLRPK